MKFVRLRRYKIFFLIWNSNPKSCHEIMALFILRKLILQTCMRSHPVGLDVWFLVEPFVYFHISCVRNSEGSGETARMCNLAWAFASRLCDKYHNLMSWLTKAWRQQQNDMHVQRRLRSAWAPTQSDQSSLAIWKKFGSLATYRYKAPSEDSDQSLKIYTRPNLNSVSSQCACGKSFIARKPEVHSRIF